MEFLWNFPLFKMREIEADLEVSVLELYYIVLYCVCECEKGNVCEIVAIKSKEKRLLFVKNNPYESLKTHRDGSFNK